MLYFGCNYAKPMFYDIFMKSCYNKIVDYRKTNNNSIRGVYINNSDGIPDSSNWFCEFGVNPNIKNIYYNDKWITIQELLQEWLPELEFIFKIEYFKPISKEEFYRTEYTVEEADKIAQEYRDYFMQFAPPETE